MSSYYDAEAAVYDETRGGHERAQAAAAAVRSLVSPPGLTVDVAGGTGIVSAELAHLGFSVLVADLSPGMLVVAANRLPGRVVVAPADRLPFRTASVDLVTMIWLLHLLPIQVADHAIAEAARVLDRGGHLVTTVDKDLAHGRRRRTNADHGERVSSVAASHGLTFVRAGSFSATTQWASAERGQVFALAAFRRV